MCALALLILTDMFTNR